ncbi:hypothetical protein Tco_0767183 [Tanacetum coccineum]
MSASLMVTITMKAVKAIFTLLVWLTPMDWFACSRYCGGYTWYFVLFYCSTPAAMDSAGSTPMSGIKSFFLDSDGARAADRFCSRVAADPDSDDEVLAEILFRGQYISGAGVVVVNKLPDDEIVDPRVKVETISESASSPPRSESESDDDMENYIPPIPYGAFNDWEILLPHVYREDLLLLCRRMNRYFRLNPDVDVGFDFWRDVNLLCQSLHSDDVEDFWRTQDEWVVSSWKLYPRSSVHVLDLTNRKTVYMFVDNVYPIRATLLERMLRHRLTVPPSYCRDVVVAGNVIQTVQAGL